MNATPGLRTGPVIVDHQGYIFMPTALYLEAEGQPAEAPNAMRLSKDLVTEALARLSPAAKAIAIAFAKTEKERQRISEQATRWQRPHCQSWTRSSFFFRMPLRVNRLQPQCGHSVGGFAVAGLRAARRLSVQAGVSVEAGIRDETRGLPRSRHYVAETGMTAAHRRMRGVTDLGGVLCGCGGCGVREKGWFARHDSGRGVGDLGAGLQGERWFRSTVWFPDDRAVSRGTGAGNGGSQPHAAPAGDLAAAAQTQGRQPQAVIIDEIGTRDGGTLGGP